jgi:NDP-sugar pyrophosphorylase family protein
MIQIVVPIGGEGRAFAERGYTFPKPLIEINGQPLIEIVVNHLTPQEPHEFIFVCRQEHLQQYALGDVLRLIAPGCRIVPLCQPTSGALCSVLLASGHFAADGELLVANADQFLDVPIDAFFAHARAGQWDGSIVTFPNTHPRWSYVKTEGDLVVGVAEKQPISRDATAGLYYFRRGGDFVKAAERMLLKNVTSGNQFYVAPVYNEFILAGLRVGTFPIAGAQMHGLGTPEEVERFQGRTGASVGIAC